jgi:GGDEF domain-containing protein
VGAGQESRLVAWCLTALLVAGAALGSLNLAFDGVLRSDQIRVVYAAALGLLLVLGSVLAVVQRVGSRTTAALVVLGDVVYVVAAWSTVDPLMYAPPLMLLLCCGAAAWFLGPRMLAVHMLLVVGACAIAVHGSHPGTAAFVVQVTVNATVLDLVTLGLFLLRRRVQRLLTQSRTLSSTDPLTGLANRRSLIEQAPRIWRQARRDGQRVAALVLDLDHFKRLNATVRPPDVLARTGGEEMVVLGLVADPSEARRLGERLRMAVAASGVKQQRPVTVSIGVALTRPVDGEDATAALWRLVDRADAAMYEAKQDGRDRVVVAGAGAVPRPRVGDEPTPRGAGGRS